MSEPIYDEDVVNLGYLNRKISEAEDNINDAYKEVSRHYASKPSTPYNAGDTWIDGDIIYTCINSRSVGNYDENDWATESGAKEEAKRKNRTFLTEPSNYNAGDMWILQSDNDHKAGKKGEILVTTVSRKEYEENDWVNQLGYGTIRSINEVANNISDALKRLKVDKESGKVTIFYSKTEPSNVIDKDLWYITESNNNYVQGTVYQYCEEEDFWKKVEDNLSIIALEEANEARLVKDGKIQSFYSIIEPTSEIGVGDIWTDVNTGKLYRYNGTKWTSVYNNRIEEIVGDVEEISRRTVEISTDLGLIKQQVTEVANIAKKVIEINQLHIIDAMSIEPGKFKIYGSNTYFKYLYPSENLYPSEELYPAGEYFTICIDKQSRENPSIELKEFKIILDEPLRNIDDIYDEFYISNEDNIAKVIRRIGINENGSLYLLDNEIEEVIEELHLTLFEGENYIYVKEFNNLKYEIEYMILNEFTKRFATRVETNSIINLIPRQIEMGVLQKLDEELTSAKIILEINNGTSQIKINSDKLELTANDILNIIAGAILNLTANNIAITSNDFKVDKNGNMECSNAKITGGKIELALDEEKEGDQESLISLKSFGAGIGEYETKITGRGLTISHTRHGQTTEMLVIDENGVHTSNEI